MQSLVKKLKLKRVVAMLLLVCTVMSTFLTSFNNIGVVKADSTDLRKTYIQMMAGRNASQIEGISDLTTDDLRCLAIYLSNFYIPFNTSLDSDSEDKNKEAMLAALTNLGINKDVAEPMIAGIYSASLNSAQKIYVKVYSDSDSLKSLEHSWNYHIGFGSDEIDPGVGTNKTFQHETYVGCVGKMETIDGESYTPVTAFLWNAIVRHLGSSSDSGISSNANGTTGINFYCIKDGKAKKCFRLDQNSLVLLTQLLNDSTQDTNGYAMNAIVNYEKSDSTWEKLTDKEKGAITCFTENLYVDWVGNIIYDAGDNRVIIYPACMNPCTFVKVDGTEKDTSTNLVSTWGQYIVNSLATEYKDNKVKTSSVSRCIDMRAYRGNTQKATWDANSWSWSKGDVGEVYSWVHPFVLTGHNDAWASTVVGYNGCAMTIDKDNSFTEFLTYKSISTRTDLDTDDSPFVIGDLTDDAYSSKYFTGSNKFSTESTDLNGFMTFGSTDNQMLSNIFLTYAYAYANKDYTSFDEKKNRIDWKFNTEVFPDAGSTAIDWGDISTISDQVLSFVYYLLHPTEGVKYVATLVKNKITGLFISWHEDIVGGTDSNVSTGMTKYLGFSGYATSPSLSDVSWLDSLLKFYNSIIVYFIIFMCVLLLCYVLTGQLTLQRGILGVVIFGLLVFAPPLAINTTVDVTNKAASQVYSNKFEYWALVQMEEYLGKLADVTKQAKSGNVNDYIASMMDLKSNEIASSISYTGTKLKWMTPKKYNDLNKVATELQNSSVGEVFSGTFQNLMINSIADSTSTEDYSESVGQTYLYRDMCDIYTYGAESYYMYEVYGKDNSLTDYSEAKISSNVKDTSSSHDTNFKDVTQNENLADAFSKIDTSNNNLYWYLAVNEPKLFSTITTDAGNAIADTSALNAIDRGFLYDTVDVKNNGTSINYLTTKSLATTYLATYRNTYSKISDNLDKLRDIVNGTSTISITDTNIKDSSILFGLEAKNFDMSINDISSCGSSFTHSGNLDKISGYYYSLYCESPYYFFNWNIHDQFKASGLDEYNKDKPADAKENFSKLLLRNNQEYFFNLTDNSGDGYGELRDFMNFHDLFYYVIPALKDGNDLVDMFDQLFGMYTYDDCSLTLSADGKWHYNNQEFNDASDFVTNILDVNDIDGDSDVAEKLWGAMTEEQRYKFWHDYNVWTIFNNYVTWLDTMQDCDYAKSETIRVMGDKFVVSNPLDPTSYYQTDASGNMTAGRYMVFSESEMKYYGLSTADLTTVEKKIISIQKSVYNTSLDLMNYYTLSDETLINAFSLVELFEFNKEFSQESIVGSDYILYPQGYELKAFTYDAYLRLIVSEASGESLMSDSDDTSSIYQRVAKNTSLFFGIFLVFNDLVAVYVVPMLKLFIICLLFLTSLLIIIGAAVKLEFNFFNVLWKSLLAPLLAYAGLSLALAFIVSMFMSNGTEGVVSTTPVISLGDPTMALICMLVLNIFFTFIYFKIVKKCIKDFKTYFSAVANSVGSAVTGLVGGVTGGLLHGKSKGSARVASTAEQRGRDNNPRSGKTGLGSALAAGAGLGLGADMLSKSEKDALDTANQCKDTMRTMNKYDKKAYEGATKREDKALLKAEKSDRKLEMAKANGANEKKLARLEKANDKKMAKYTKLSDKSKTIAKYGKVGSMKRNAKENLKTAGAGMKKAGGRIKSGTLTAVNGGLASAIGAGAAKARNAMDTTARGLKQAAGAPSRAYKSAKKGMTTVMNNASSAVNKARTEIYYNGDIRGTFNKYTDNAKSFADKKLRLAGASAKKQLARQNDAMHMGYTFNRK